MDAPCAVHDSAPAVARCNACDRPMCADCYEVTVDGKPTCNDCVPLVTGPISPVVPVVAAALALMVIARIAYAARAGGAITIVAASAAAVLAILSAWRIPVAANKKRAARVVAKRPPAPPTVVTGHPFRGALRRSARRLAPPVSGVTAVLIVAAALTVTGLVVPASLHLSWWVELELVVAAWWLVWTTILTVLLYRGWRVAEDRS